ncbi:MAG: molybdopterin-dependent oxidoreductase [Oscillospiraceae bacterium]|nr:molybdopterin-dependent oxidoreductase [Oscillospiraceae bacterium]
MKRNRRSRRVLKYDFLKAADIAIDASSLQKYGGLSVQTAAVSQDAGEVQKIRTTCRACISNCGVIATVKNGRVVKLEGDPKNKMSRGRMCAKGLSGIQALYNPNRNKYPLVRVGKRGENKWKRISWDDALTQIATKLLDIKAKYGAEAVMCSTGGGGNPQFTSPARFCNLFGTPNWFEPGCAQCYLPRQVAYGLMYGGTDPSIADSNSLEIYYADRTPMKSLCLWGTDPSYSCPGQGGGALVELRAKGVKTVVIDPRLTPDAAKADVWLPIRPGTDVALQLAWIRYMLEHKLYNEEFVLKWTNLPYLVNVETGECWRAGKSTHPKLPDTFMVWDKKTNSAQPLEYPWNDAYDVALEGTWEIDGVTYKTGFQLLKERCEEWTLEKAAEVCWLDADMIEKGIRTFCENTPGGLCIGVATDQNPNSVQAGMGAVIIDLLLGNVEQPGSLLQRFGALQPTDFSVVPFCESKLPYEQLVKRLGGIEYKGLHMWHAAHAPSCLQAIKTGKPYPVKAWLDRSGNKLAVLANGTEWVEAMDNLDLIVHMYMYPTSFSAYADYLLPTTEWLETNYLQQVCNTVSIRQPVDHLYETIDECLIWSLLTQKCAELGDKDCARGFDAEYMGKDFPCWDNMTEVMEHFTKRYLNMTWDEFKEASKDGPIEYMPEEDFLHYYVYKDIRPETGKPRGFNTSTRKCELYGECFITLSRTGMPFSGEPLPPASHDYDPLPYYMEPHESPLPECDLSKEYPLVMTNGRIPFYHHSTLRNIPWLREIYPAPELWINPETAEQYGVADGDWVWVESLRNKVRAIANVTPGIGKGVVYMERFWNPEKLNTETHGWKEMNVNLLSKSDAPYNDVVGTYTLRGYQVKVSKADGPPEGVWLEPRDFRPWLPEAMEHTPELSKKEVW